MLELKFISVTFAYVDSQPIKALKAQQWIQENYISVKLKWNLLKRIMGKMLVIKNENSKVDSKIGTNCNACDVNFHSEESLKEHILTTVHKVPADGTRNFKY